MTNMMNKSITMINKMIMTNSKMKINKMTMTMINKTMKNKNKKNLLYSTTQQSINLSINMSAPNDDFQDTSAVPAQDDYVSRTGQSEIPVERDGKTVEGGYDNRDQADSDAQLQADEKDAIDSSNIIEERTRGAKPAGTYTEPGDEEGLGGNDGRSRVAGGPN